MKKIVLYCIIICLFIAVGITLIILIKNFSFKKTVEKTMKEVQVINENSNFGMKYFQFAGLSEESAKQFNDDKPGMDGTTDRFVYGYYFHYPPQKQDGDRRLTQIYITGGEYHLFGIHIGDNIIDTKKVLKQRGYKEKESRIKENEKKELKFQKEDLFIVLTVEPQSPSIAEICIYVNH